MLLSDVRMKNNGKFKSKKISLRDSLMKWTGPYTIDELLDSILHPAHPRPPESDGVYLISKVEWSGEPAKDCIPLSVGSNTGRSKRFRTRIGDLIADMFGFFTDDTGHHSGGQSLHGYCKKEQLNPKELLPSMAVNFTKLYEISPAKTFMSMK